MSQSKQNTSASGGIYIRETIGGVPTEKPSAPRRSSRRGADAAKPARKSDPYIWGTYILLVIVSIIELYSASATEVVGTNVYGPLIRHCLFLGIGFALLYLLQRMHYGYIARFAVPIGLLSLGALLISTFAGVEINGAQRAFMIGPFTVQPPEIVKLTVIIWLAAILAKSQKRHDVATWGIVYSAIVVALFGGLLALNGLTNTLLVMVVSVSLCLLCGIPCK